jgi:hypothetical protein
MSVRPAFAQLQRALLARTASRIEPRLRVELALLTLLTWGFTFWRARIPFDSLTRERGWGASVWALAGTLGFLAIVGATAAALHHVRQLRARAAGPSWLALPLPAGAILEHLAWRARWQGAWAVVLAPGVLAAAVGLVPWWAVIGLALAFVIVLLYACRLATFWVRRRVVAQSERKSATDPSWVLLTTSARPTVVTRIQPPAWRRRPVAVALGAKDLRLTRRPTAARARAIAPLLFAVLSASVWWIAGTQTEIPTELVRFVAFGLALVASAAFAEWLIALASSDPSPVLRGLPLGAGDVWLGRALLLIGFVTLVLAGQAVAARPLAVGPLQVHLVWLGAATLAVGLLGIHYSLTLPATAAARVLVLTLSIAMAASIMIPLLGWVLLLTAVIHSARRVPRWPRIEETA